MSSQKHQVFIKSQSWDTLVVIIVLVVIVVVVFDRDLVDIVIIDIVIVVDVFDVLDILVKKQVSIKSQRWVTEYVMKCKEYLL